MKLNSLLFCVCLCFLLTMGMSWEVGAYEQKQDFDKLKKTGECAKCDLSGIRIDYGQIASDADLSGANLNNVRFQNVSFSGNMSKASLIDAYLYKGDFSGTNFQGANLTEASIAANLRGANLEGANLTNANFVGISLWGANLTGANLTGANLAGTNLTEVNLTGAILTDAKLSRSTELDGAVLTGAILPDVSDDDSAEEMKKWIRGSIIDGVKIRSKRDAEAFVQDLKNRQAELSKPDSVGDGDRLDPAYQSAATEGKKKYLRMSAEQRRLRKNDAVAFYMGYWHVRKCHENGFIGNSIMNRTRGVMGRIDLKMLSEGWVENKDELDDLWQMMAGFDESGLRSIGLQPDLAFSLFALMKRWEENLWGKIDPNTGKVIEPNCNMFVTYLSTKDPG